MCDDELTEFLLEMLPSTGYLTIGVIVQSWLDAAAIKVPERLKQLEAEGQVKSPKAGRWRLAPK